MSNKNKRIEAQIDLSLDESLSVCCGVLQRYFAYLADRSVDELFKEPMNTREVGFQDSNGRLWFLKFDLVDRDWNFPIDKLNVKPVRDAMTKMCRQLQFVAPFVLHEMNKTLATVPEYFCSSKMAVTPNTTAFLYSEKYGKYIHDTVNKRIGFVWTVEGESTDKAIQPPPPTSGKPVTAEDIKREIEQLIFEEGLDAETVTKKLLNDNVN